MPSGKDRGFTYVALLIAVAVIGAGLAGAAELWSQQERRERERDLLFIGGEFRRAIERYYRDSPGVAKNYPQELSELIEDRRFPTPRRHLRRMYRDPMTGRAEWDLLEAPTGGIMGVRSLSSAETLKKAGFRMENRALEGANRYSEWEFRYEPVAENSPGGSARPR
jgi:type II secretory pathway pseudopilin PulG